VRFANYVARLDDLKSLIGFASRYEEMQELLAQIMLLEQRDAATAPPIPTPMRCGSTTVHQAKGLEYAAVLPDRSRRRHASRCAGAPSRPATSRKSDGSSMSPSPAPATSSTCATRR
jgi:hypothetical protein